MRLLEVLRSTGEVLMRPSGGMPLRIISAVLTLVVVGVLIASVLHFQQEQHKLHYSKALVIAEYGLQQALEKLQREPSWQAGFVGTPYSKGSYAVAMITAGRGDTLRLHLESVGRSGSATRSKEMELVLAVQGNDSVWMPIDIK